MYIGILERVTKLTEGYQDSLERKKEEGSDEYENLDAF